MPSIIEAIKGRHEAQTRGKDIGVAWCAMSERRNVKATDQPEMCEAIINTGGIDLVDEVVVPRGIDWSYFKVYKSIYWNHDAGGSTLPVGKLRNLSLRTGPDRWAASWIWASNPFAQQVKVAVQEEVCNGTSIGFVPTDRGTLTEDERAMYGDAATICRSSIGLEFSVTPQPCLPDAMIGGKSMEPSEDLIRGLERLVQRGRITKQGAQSMGLPEPKPQLRKIIFLEPEPPRKIVMLQT